jgi:isopenicillin-N N-acyltransferase-like protein
MHRSSQTLPGQRKRRSVPVRILRIFLFMILGLVILITGLLGYVWIVSRVTPPVPLHVESRSWQRKDAGDNLYVIGSNWFRKSETGLYELYVEGEPYERGEVIGKLSKELIQSQEKVFNEQIHLLIPSRFYLGTLEVFVGWFNRNLEDDVPEEYKEEILGISESASHDYDNIAPPYQRLLNYHAAHDIGHALQNLSLVGCTSFATWGEKSEDSSLIIGRNFDFYVGDQFAQNKIIAFYSPSQGHKFMMVTWGGMTGVLSGMNNDGLTVTINAAKSEIVAASATPVSIVAREVLQYASTIDEAYAIIQKRKMFVAESFLIGSARDHKAAIIEKSTDAQDLYESSSDYIICTNHFQGKELGNTPLNQEHIKTSASMYRYQRVQELLDENGKNSVEKTAAILRNQKGLHDEDIGMGNEKSINQLIAHHSIIFQPEKQLVWISTGNWQLGKYVCYDLNKIFSMKLTANHEIYDTALTIPADTFLSTSAFASFLKFSKYRFPFLDKHEAAPPDSLIQWNPNSYLAWLLAGNQEFDAHEFNRAEHYYKNALTKEIATLQERDYIEKQITRCKEKK